MPSLASVSAGRSADGWIAALSGWFLIHGHAAFLFIVPAMVAVPVAVRAWPTVRSGLNLGPLDDGDEGDNLREFARGMLARWRGWLPAAVISAVFALR